MFCISLANLRKWVKIPYNLLFVVLGILSYALYESYEQNRLLDWQIQSKDARIRDIESQLPQIYYTRHANQAIYYWDSSYIKADSYWKDADVCVTVYLEKDGYGMTEFGWVPMESLRR